MRYDSRRWTGRTTVDELGARGDRPSRYRAVRWMLAFVFGMSLFVAIAQVVVPSGDRQDALTHLAILFSAFGTASGCSSFARRRCRDYDEFERTVIMQAHRRAYRLIFALVALPFIWCAVATAQAWPMPRHPLDWLVWAVSLLVIASNLPVMLAEFAISFPEQEDAA
jgi:hypothetical protein